MSEASTRADLTLLMADFVNDGIGGKFNMIGGGINILKSPLRFSVLAKVDIPGEICPVQATIELALLGQDDKVIPLPGEDDEGRLTEVVTFEKPTVGTIASPGLRFNYHISLDFTTELLPLESGSFKWSLRVDGDDKRARVLDFVVVR